MNYKKKKMRFPFKWAYNKRYKSQNANTDKIKIFENNEEDLPDYWMSKGVRMINSQGYKKPPLCICENDKVQICYSRESVAIYVTSSDSQTKIETNYLELQGEYDFVSVINYLNKRGIIK